MQSNLIAQNIKILQSEINTIAEKNVKLIAVSKKKPLAMIEQAFDLGINDFGENFAQELKEKAETSSKNITWHFIRPIQSNKIKDIAKYSNWVHSIEREKVAKKLNEHALMHNKIINSLIQVNIDSENSKSGVSLDALFELKDYILKNCENLNLRGLMFMPRFTLDKNEKDESLKKICSVISKFKNIYKDADTFSFGTTHDYQLSIKNGSNMIRVGEKIFGKRI